MYGYRIYLEFIRIGFRFHYFSRNGSGNLSFDLMVLFFGLAWLSWWNWTAQWWNWTLLDMIWQTNNIQFIHSEDAMCWSFWLCLNVEFELLRKHFLSLKQTLHLLENQACFTRARYVFDCFCTLKYQPLYEYAKSALNFGVQNVKKTP